jgi:hypothetical protein
MQIYIFKCYYNYKTRKVRTHNMTLAYLLNTLRIKFWDIDMETSLSISVRNPRVWKVTNINCPSNSKLRKSKQQPHNLIQ